MNYTHEPFGRTFLWIPKRVAIGSTGWNELVMRANKCPDQRLYRRLTRAERKTWEKIKR